MDDADRAMASHINRFVFLLLGDGGELIVELLLHICWYFLFLLQEEGSDGSEGHGDDTHVIQPADDGDDIRDTIQGADGVEQHGCEDGDVARGEEGISLAVAQHVVDEVDALEGGGFFAGCAQPLFSSS